MRRLLRGLLLSRTSSQRVQELLGKDYGQLPDGTMPALTPYIRSASKLVDRVVSEGLRRSLPLALDSEEQEILEQWLSAHFYCQMDPSYTSKSNDGASGSFMGQGGLQLQSTRYGQTALLLDVTGVLAQLNKRAVARVAWAGKPPSQQIPYCERD